MSSYIDDGSVESHRFFLSRRTLFEMLRDRGYDVPDSELTRSLTEFRSEFGHKPDLQPLRICRPLLSNPSKRGSERKGCILKLGCFGFRKNGNLNSSKQDGCCRSQGAKEILVIFCGTDEIRKGVIKGIFGQIVNKESLHRVMLILQSKMNSFARKEVDKFPIKVEIFQITDLLVNITKHILMPNTAVEKEILLKKYKLEDNQLPWMLVNDAIARYYALEKGQVVRVTYSGGNPGSMVTYRCVM